MFTFASMRKYQYRPIIVLVKKMHFDPSVLLLVKKIYFHPLQKSPFTVDVTIKFQINIASIEMNEKKESLLN